MGSQLQAINQLVISQLINSYQVATSQWIGSSKLVATSQLLKNQLLARGKLAELSLTQLRPSLGCFQVFEENFMLISGSLMVVKFFRVCPKCCNGVSRKFKENFKCFIFQKFHGAVHSLQLHKQCQGLFPSRVVPFFFFFEPFPSIYIYGLWLDIR